MVASAEKKNDEVVKRSEEALTKLIQILDKIPFADKKKTELQELRSLIQSLRPPRIMVIGRARSGKSSLINAICGMYVCQVSSTTPETGKAEWFPFYRDGFELVRILDTRGLQESETPRQIDAAATPEASIIEAVNCECPDLILMVCKATDVCSATQADIKICESIIEHIKYRYKYDISLVAVLTKCDEIDPPKIDFPTDDKEKNDNLDKLVTTYIGYLNQSKSLSYSQKDIVPTTAYAKYQEGQNGLIITDKDYRWNIDELIYTMMMHTPKERQGGISRMGDLKKTQITIANKLINICVALSAAASIISIPGSSLIATNFIQSLMVSYIAWLGGREFSDEAIKDFVATAGTFAIADIALEFVPGVGNVIRAGTNGVATKGIGDLAVKYYLKDT